MPSRDQILTAEQVRAAEAALIAGGTSVEALMQVAGRGAADWVWRMAGRHKVTVLCGPGNNGGDGYVLAQAIRERGGNVVVVAATDPKTEAARAARQAYGGEVLDRDADVQGEVLVDCLYGTGLTRPLSSDDAALLERLGAAHCARIAIDVPSGVESDSGALIGALLAYDITIALGAWKFAHFLMPASAMMGALHLVPIGLAPQPGAASVIKRPRIAAPAADAHKYKRGLLAVVGGAMPGAAILAATAAQQAGAGYVRLFAKAARDIPADLVVDDRPLSEALADKRNSAILVGMGLGRDQTARERLAIALANPAPVVVDADALMLLGPHHLAKRAAATICTPHEGELAALERAFELDGKGPRPTRALALARASGMIVVAKGPDTVIATPGGRLACARRASSWLSTAGTGDVLAGTIASRLATGTEPFAAACEGVWLHGEAARLAGVVFTAGELAHSVSGALAECLHP